MADDTPTQLTDIRGIGPGLAALLETAGLRTVQDVAAAPLDTLAAVRGISATRAALLRDAARALLAAAPAADPLLTEPVVAAPADDAQAADPLLQRVSATEDGDGDEGAEKNKKKGGKKKKKKGDEKKDGEKRGKKGDKKKGDKKKDGKKKKKKK